MDLHEAKKRKPLILIVDDNPRNIQLVGAVLKNNTDCDFAFAMDGFQALKQAQKTPPDLILLDVMMPEMDGYQTCERLKADPETAAIPVIFLTARVQSEDIVRGFDVGAADYVAKPFQSAELLARVRTQLKIKEGNDIIQRQNDERKQLLHVLCHDLVNPFSSIVSCLDIIDDAESFLTLKPRLLQIAENGLNLIELVRRIRSIEEKGLPPMTEDTPLTLLAERSHMLMDERLKNKNITLRVDVPDNLTVKVDPVSFINTVLNNLVSNAVKFSYPGSTVELKGSLEEGQVVIRVVDHGIGIPDDILRGIFDLGKMTTRTGTANERGTGFGMPLVQQFVAAGGGTIEICSRSEKDSPDDHGTEVIIRMPHS